MFKIGQIYRRRELHQEYGGQEQGGISTPANNPIIFIFSGSSGEQHGYSDGWDEENYFNYSGEGQKGDMKFTKGNLAIRDHVKNGKSIYLFEFESKGLWKYIDQLELVDYSYHDTPDSEGNIRKGIRFKLKSTTEESKNKEGAKRVSKNFNKPDTTERKGLVTSRVGQGWYRHAILDRWDYKCAVTGSEMKNILIASHIVPWRDCDDKERLDVDNGILLSPVYDALFDKHLITFSKEGKIVLSDKIDRNQFKLLGITGEEKIDGLSKGNKKYLKRHNSTFNENN